MPRHRFWLAALPLLLATGSPAAAEQAHPASAAEQAHPVAATVVAEPVSRPQPEGVGRGRISGPGQSELTDVVLGGPAGAVGGLEAVNPVADVAENANLPAELATETAAQVAQAAKSTKPLGPKADYVVLFRDSADVTGKVSGFAKSLAVRASHTYRNAFKGFAASMTAAQYLKVRDDPSVAAIVPDRPIHAEGQIIPTGVERVGAAGTDTPGADSILSPVDADIAIVDTGMPRNHPDLNVVGGHNCTNRWVTNWEDGYGHGTHVAGTAGALDNGYGVVGVAPGARLWAVRVFDNWGNGKISWYACGLEWIVSQRDPTDSSKPRFEVANMSLRTAGTNDDNCGLTIPDPLHRAICRAVARGTTVIVAAGNDHVNVARWIPAAYPEVITVSALADFDGVPGGLGASTCSSWGSADSDDTFANFSNFGWRVDMMASGKCIYSTYLRGGYKVMSGTSMATPAVAGAAALWKSLHPDATPATVKAVLQGAGRLDWNVRTDPDTTHERMLNVSSFGAGPSWSVYFSGGTQYVGAAGGTVKLPLEVTRNDAFAGQLDVDSGNLPHGWSGGFDRTSLPGLTSIRSVFSVQVPAGEAAGTYEVQATARSDGETQTAVGRVRVDAEPPSVLAPWVRLTGGTVGLASAPLIVSWSASDTGTGVRAVELQQSTDGGAFARIGTFSPGTTRFVRYVNTSHTYQFRTRASDNAGNMSPWAEGSTFQLLRIEQQSRKLSYTGIWSTQTASWASGGSLRYSSQKGATATMSLFGSAVAWVAPRGQVRGWAQVYVDGQYVQIVSLYSRTSIARKIAFVYRWATRGAHTVTVRVYGTPERPRIDVDAFIVLR